MPSMTSPGDAKPVCPLCGAAAGQDCGGNGCPNGIEAIERRQSEASGRMDGDEARIISEAKRIKVLD